MTRPPEYEYALVMFDADVGVNLFKADIFALGMIFLTMTTSNYLVRSHSQMGFPDVYDYCESLRINLFLVRNGIEYEFYFQLENQLENGDFTQLGLVPGLHIKKNMSIFHLDNRKFWVP